MITTETYPRCELWDYIATSKEDREIEHLRNLRAAIVQSKKEFEEGKGILLESKFFEHFAH